MRYCWLANTTGHPDGFLPFDEVQEHNVCGIKVCSTLSLTTLDNKPCNQHTFVAIGPNATWDYIKKISAAIPTLRKIKDHVEADINHYRRGKRHTNPASEEDIAKLQAMYANSKLHVNDPRAQRRLPEKDRIEDFVMQGSDYSKLSTAIRNWAANRTIDRATTEDWTYGYEDSAGVELQAAEENVDGDLDWEYEDSFRLDDYHYDWEDFGDDLEDLEDLVEGSE